MHEFNGPYFDRGLIGPNGKLTRLHKGGGGDDGWSAIAAQQLAESRRQFTEQMAIQKEQAAKAEAERIRLLNQGARYDPNSSMPEAGKSGAGDAEGEARALAARRKSMANAVIAGEAKTKLGNSQQALGA